MSQNSILTINLNVDIKKMLMELADEHERPMVWVISKLIQAAYDDRNILNKSGQFIAIANQESPAVSKEQLERDLRIVNIIDLFLDKFIEEMNDDYDNQYYEANEVKLNIAGLIDEIKSELNCG